MKTKKYKWMSLVTGELATNILEVIKIIVDNRVHWHFWNLKWKRYKTKF